MIPEIKAVETVYKGYRFRSRLEARWAVFFDTVRVSWEYEKEGYTLPSGNYLPDFYLPRLGCWLEIKGQVPTGDEMRKCEELYYATDSPVAIAHGLPAPADDLTLQLFITDNKFDSSAGTSWWYIGWGLNNNGVCFWADYDPARRGFFRDSDFAHSFEEFGDKLPPSLLTMGINAAKAVRFEP